MIEWQPIETAPPATLCLLAVQAKDGERRTFVAMRTYCEKSDGFDWKTTVGVFGWLWLRGGWSATHWMPLLNPPKE